MNKLQKHYLKCINIQEYILQNLKDLNACREVELKNLKCYCSLLKKELQK